MIQRSRTSPRLHFAAIRIHAITPIHLMLFGMLALIWVFLSLTPLPPNDLWWHMAAGRTMVAEGAWLRDNRWAYTLPADTPYIYQSWLSEICMYWLWRVGNVPLLALARMLLIAGSYALMSWHAWRRGGPTGALGALLLAILVGWSNWTLRPQTFALLPGVAFGVVLGEYGSGRMHPRRLVRLPLLMLVWVNLHGSFILGLALLGVSWLGALIDAARDGTLRSFNGRVRALTLAGVATGLAALIHPLGLNVFGYVRGMLTNAPSQQLIVEWQPPRNTVDLLATDFWFFVVLLLLAVLMARGPRRPSWTDLLWFCGLAWLALGGGRYIIWFGLFMMPLLAEQIAPLASQHKRTLTRAQQAGATGALIAVLVVALPWFGVNRVVGAEQSRLFASEGPYRTLLADTTPIAAAQWLGAHPPERHLWSNMTYNSYLVWAAPAIPVFIDQRVDMFPLDLWKDYNTIAAGSPQSLELLERWQVSTVLLDQRRDTRLLDRLKATPGWCIRYRDQDAIVLSQCAP